MEPKAHPSKTLFSLSLKRYSASSFCLFDSQMASSSPQGSVDPLTGKDPAKALTAVASGFIDNVKKNKQSFFQFFAMTGILLLSFRSVSQKYRIHDLEEDTATLKKEQDSLMDRMCKIKSDLLHQASIDSTGVFASRLRLLFGDDKN